jgi:putative ABC transport system permease protein
MLAVGEAARYEAVEQIKTLGATNIIVRSVKPNEDNQRSNNQGLYTYGLTYRDLERIQDTIPTITAITPLREFRKDIRYLDKKLDGRVVSVTPNYLVMNGLKLSSGRFISDVDNERFANVAVLGNETAEILFPLSEPLGYSIRVGDSHFYQVIGVTEKRAPSAGVGSSLAAQDFNRDVYIPFNTDKVRFGSVVTYFGASSVSFEKLEISQLTLTVDKMENVKKTAELISGTLEQFHTKKDTAVTVPLDLLERAEETKKIFTLVLGAIASISLVVGGIGIMNIMLATVTERTHEIGIRRALGARRRDIGAQFLMETVVLSSCGGVAGMALGIALSYALTHYFGLQTIIRPWSPLLAFGVSVAVGLIFGTYPARRAANMDPIEALRHE